MSRRVVITGLGTVNALGNNTADSWKAVKNGENGIGKITRFNTEGFPSTIGGEVKDLDYSGYIDKKEARRMDDFTLYSVVAAMEAMDDAGLKAGENVDPERIGVIIGNGIGGINTLATNIITQHEKGPKSVYPLLIPKMIINISPGSIALKLNALGPNYSVVTACASGTDAIGNAMKWIREGAVDAMITGGTEAPFEPIALGGFCALQALSTRNDDPQRASRPFDKDRDGFVMAEGAGIIIIEELEHAKKRGAKIYAEVAGYGATCDAYHLTAPHSEGRGAIAAMKMAVNDAGLKLEDIDYINAHGTSTPINDPIETLAIRGAFGEHAYKLKVSSTKSMTGHSLGAAGGIEAVVTALAIKEQFFPPTRNMDEADPQCDLDYIPHKGYQGRIRAALSNSLGFGGHNAIICIKEYKA